MPLNPGRHLGSYEILAAIGAGGMGEVYRARDLRLGRDVAIKVLPESFAADAERLGRFEREAQLLASLNHPNIAAIYGIEDSDGARALVMELVEGEDLSQRITNAATERRAGSSDPAIPVLEVLPIARQIASALEAAHEQGIIHRDLKPANIKVRPDGTVKVLDFGLAKLVEAGGAGGSGGALTMSPTLSSPALMTGAGFILGTAAYMSPEQARGKPVDRRADIWAFGCVLFEMLTGAPAFDPGETVSDAVAAILTKEPDWSALPAATPTNIRTLLHRCLQKDPQKRLPHIGVARIEIDEGPTSSLLPAQAVGATAALAAARPRENRARWLGAAAVVGLIGLGIPAGRHLLEAPAAAPPELRTEIVTPSTIDPGSFALSPDGQHVVFVASGDGPSRLWLRSLASTSAAPLAGTEGAANPFWSPDNRSIGFFADGKLKRFDVGGGTPRILTSVATPRGGAWNAEGVILFTPTTRSPILRIAASGGEAVAVTRLEKENNHRFPVFLPDGRHFLFFAQGSPEVQGIYLGSLDSSSGKRLVASDVSAMYTAPGWLLWVRGSTLVAQRLDLEQGALTGDPLAVADPVGSDAGVNTGDVSTSASGLIAYRAGGLVRRQLAWFDRTGRMLETFGAPDGSSLQGPRLSPDNRRVVAYRIVEGNFDIWLLDGARMSRFTFDASADRYPIWSPDGSRIVFDSIRTGGRDLYIKASSGAGAEEVLFGSPQAKVAYDWSPDGRFLMYATIGDPQTGYDIWMLPMKGDRKPWLFLKSNFNERNAQFSPDGRWVAYASDESGRFDVYVRSFVEPGQTAINGRQNLDRGQWQLSTGGGIFPRWRPDGKELYYVAPDGAIVGVPVSVGATTFDAGTPVRLFVPRMWGGGTNIDLGRQYEVAKDGRFLVNMVLDDTSAAPITILQNWRPPAN